MKRKESGRKVCKLEGKGVEGKEEKDKDRQGVRVKGHWQNDYHLVVMLLRILFLPTPEEFDV